MKKVILLIVSLGIINTLEAQSILKTADNKSGILVGTQNSEDFAGITYERGSDEFLFNYRFNQQMGSWTGTSYPDFWGLNIGLNTDLKKNKAPLVANRKFQGGVGVSLTFSYTDEKAQINTSGISIPRIIYKASGDPVDYESMRDCITKNGNNCSRISTSSTHYEPQALSQNTYFLRIEYGLSRVGFAELSALNVDTTFLATSTPLINTWEIAPGFMNISSTRGGTWITSWSISVPIQVIGKSSSGLEQSRIQPVNAIFFNESDTSILNSIANEESYFIGESSPEVRVIPRFDLFTRWYIAKDKPYLGVIASISPIFSSLSDVKTRWNLAIGPSFSLPSFPDQVVFALMSEWLENDKGRLNYSLTFHASVPIKFK